MASNQYQSALEQARSEIKGMLNDFNEVDKKILQIAANAAKIGKTDFSGGSPKELNERLQKNATYRKQVNAEMKEAERLNKALAAAQAKFYSAQSGTNKQLNQTRFETNQINKLQREAAVLNSQLATQYQKTSAELNKMRREYKDLAIQEELEIKLTKEQIAEKDRLRDQIERYDKALKKVDADTGQYNRNVGNYKSGWDGLGVSVQQIAREMPAFANSMQTGFMAISNNIPMLVDQINLLKAANKELAATGKPTQSVFKQLAGAVFNWQTLISVGVTLLTVYGAELFEMAFGASEAEKQQKKLNEAISEGNQQAVQSSSTIRLLKGIIQDENATNRQKSLALQELKKDVVELRDVELDQADAMEKIIRFSDSYIKATEARAKADAFASLAAETEAELIRRRQEGLENNVEWYDYITSAVKNFGNATAMSSGVVDEAQDRRNKGIKEEEAFLSTLNEKQKEYLTEALELEDGLEGLNNTRQDGIQALDGSIAAMEQVISSLEEEQNKLAVGSKAWWEYQKQIEEAERGLVKMKGEIQGVSTLIAEEGIKDFDPFDYDKMTESQKEAYNQLVENTQRATDLLTEQWETQSKRKKDYDQQQAQSDREKWDQIIDYTKQSVDVLGDFGTALFQRRISNLQNELEFVQENYDAQIEAAEGNEEQQQAIREEKAARETELKNKLKEEQRKEAIFQKSLAILSIGINTASAIIAALAPPPVGLGPVAGLPLSVATGALGAIQIATVLATPIPALEQGDLTGKHEGLVQINDARGAQFKEIIQRANGEMEVYGGRNVLIDKKRGDKVYKAGTAPAGYDYNDIMNASINMSLADQHGRLSQAEARQSFDSEMIRQTMESELKKAVSAIKGIKINNTINNKSSDFAAYRAAQFKRRA